MYVINLYILLKLPAAILFAAIFISGSARAGSISQVTTRANLQADETLDWGGFGAADTGVVSGSTLTTSSGMVVTVTQPFYEMQIRQEGLATYLSGWWLGDFLPGQVLLTNWNSPFAVTLGFSRPIFGAGLQIEPGQVSSYPTPFTAIVTAFAGDTMLGRYSVEGSRSFHEDGSAPFLGIADDVPEITSLLFQVSVHSNSPYTGDLGMNFLSLQTAAPVPEPSSGCLGGCGLMLGLVLWHKRKDRTQRGVMRAEGHGHVMARTTVDFLS